MWKTWTLPIRCKLGTWLLNCIIEESGWFAKSTERIGKKTENYIVPTPEFMKIKDAIVDTAEMFSPIAYPMLIELMIGNPHDLADTF